MIPDIVGFSLLFVVVSERWHGIVVKSRRSHVVNLCKTSRTNYGKLRCVFKRSVFLMRLAQQIVWFLSHFAAILKCTTDIVITEYE